MNKEKLKKILRSNVFIGGLCFALGVAVMYPNKGIGITKERYNQLLEMERVVLQKNRAKSEKPGKHHEAIGENKPFALNEVVYLTDMSRVKLVALSVSEVELITERNDYSDVEADKVVRVEYTYENIGMNNSLCIHENNFKVYDSDGNILENYPMDIDKHPQGVSKGKKCTAEMFFALNNVSNDLEIEFYENPFNPKPNAVFKVKAK